MEPRDLMSRLMTEGPNRPLLASAYPDDLNEKVGSMSDEEAMRKIGQRTSWTSRLLALLMIGGAVGLGYFYVARNEAYEGRQDLLDAAGQFEPGSPEMLAKVREALETSTYPDVKVRAIKNLSHFDDAGAVPLYIKELATPGVVRAHAAIALSRLGSPAADSAKPELLKALATADESDRPQIVWALAVLKEPNATDAILEEFVQGRLQKQEDFDPKVITEAIGIQKLSSPELTGNEQMPIRALVAMALAEAASPDVVDPLVRMIQRPDEETEVVRAAVAGLGRAGDARAAQPLFQLMQSRADMRQSVIDALKKSTAAPQLAVLLKEAKEPATQRDLVVLLRGTHDPRGADALASLTGSEDLDIRVETAHGLAELGDPRAVEPLIALARDQDDTTGNDAVDALRRLGRPEAAGPLMEMFTEFPHRKAAIMRALGATGAMQAGPLLEKELAGDDVGSAAKALGQLKYEKAFGKLVSMVTKPKGMDFSKPSVVTEVAYRTRFEAIQGLRYFGKPDPKAAAELIKVIEDPTDDFRLADAAGIALGQLADDKIYATIIEKIRNTELDERVRVAYAQGLWVKPNNELAKQLLGMINANQPAAIRRVAALAVGYAGDPSNGQQLSTLLESEGTRRDAAIAIVLGGGGVEPAKKLLELLKDDRDLREVLQMEVLNAENDNFNLLTEEMFTSGQIWRRLLVGEVLREGTSEQNAYTYYITQTIARLGLGWEGPGGVSALEIRKHLYDALIGSDAELRRLAASCFAQMNERGLLLAARDAGNTEARQELMRLDRPRIAS